MPLNESSGNFRRGQQLTNQQKRDQEAALYGLQSHNAMNESLNSLTPEQIAKLLALADGPPKVPQGPQVFDLNHPPVAPYQFQPYPKMVYRNGETRTVYDETQYIEAAGQGWRDRGLIGVPDEPIQLDDASASTAESLDADIRKRRNR